MKPLSIRDCYRVAVAALKPSYHNHAPSEAQALVRALLQHHTDHDPLLDNPAALPEFHLQRSFFRALHRRLCHEPLSRIVGKRAFWDGIFNVTPHTLDPRPDSETLIEAVLLWLKNRPSPRYILDLGTGTGCLLISLLRLFPEAQGWGVDCSPQALSVATQNAHRHGVGSRFFPIDGDWNDPHFSPHTPPQGWDVIISNPPYIGHEEFQALAPNVKDYDPPQALWGGHDGLEAYRALAQRLPTWSREGTGVFLEIGHMQQSSVCALFQPPLWRTVATHQDLAGHDRVVVIVRGISQKLS